MAEKISSQLRGMGFGKELDEFEKFIQHFGDEGYSYNGWCDSHESRHLECVSKCGDFYAVLVRKHSWYDGSCGSSGIGMAAQIFVVQCDKLVVGEEHSFRDHFDARKDRPDLAFDEIVKADRKDGYYNIRIRCSRKGTEKTVSLPVSEKRGK